MIIKKDTAYVLFTVKILNAKSEITVAKDTA